MRRTKGLAGGARGTRTWGTRLLAALALSLAVLAGAGPAPAVPATAAGATVEATPDDVLIAGATVFDGSGRAPYRADVLVLGGRIERIGQSLQAPAGVARVEARGDALLPGLIDVHTHWTPAGEPATLPQIANAYLANGVTTVNDFHQAPEAWAPRREWLARIAAPQVRFAARLSTPYGHGADWADEATTRWVNSPEAARAAVDAVAAYRPDLVKAFTDGWRYNNAPDNTSMDERTLAAVVEQAHRHGLEVATHTVTVARGTQAGRAGVDVIAHSLLDGPVDDALLATLRERGVAYAPTLAVYEPVRMADRDKDPDDPVIRQRARNFEQALANVRRLYEAGVAIALGTDAGMPGTPHGAATLHELELLVRAGLPPEQALLAGTANSARALGLEDRGTIAPGKRADLVLVKGRPWERIGDMRRIQRVWVGGRQWHGPGTRLPPGNVRTALPPEEVDALVDDFERDDGRTALDTLRTDEADGGNERTVQVTEVVAREDQGHALSIQARMSHGDRRYASVILPLTRGSVAPADLRRYRALHFELRGEAREVTLELRGLDGRRWTHALQPSSGWQRMRIPFDALRPEPPFRGRGQAAPWRGDDVQQIVFRISDEAGSKAWLQVDEVRFE